MKCPTCGGTGELLLAKLFKDARQAKHLTLREVEGLVGVSNAFLSQIESGKVKNPSFETVMKLCRLYGIKPESIT